MFTEFITSPTPEDKEVARSILNADARFSDDSGLSNMDKWGFSVTVFGKYLTLFDSLDYYTLYMTDDDTKSEAMQYFIDLRVQFLQEALDAHPGDHALHWQYLHNKVWYVRFRERLLVGAMPIPEERKII